MHHKPAVAAEKVAAVGEEILPYFLPCSVDHMQEQVADKPVAVAAEELVGLHRRRRDPTGQTDFRCLPFCLRVCFLLQVLCISQGPFQNTFSLASEAGL